MMKSFTGLFLTFILLAGQVNAAAFSAPDILIDSKLDMDWSGLLISKVRRLLKNYNITDPFKVRFDQPLVVNESIIADYLTPDSRELMNDLGQVIGLNLLNGKTKVTLNKFGYDIKDFRTELKSSEKASNGILIASDFSASEVHVTADKITLGLFIPSKDPQASPFLEIEIIKPVIRAREKNLIKFFAKFKIEDKKDFYQLDIKQTDFNGMAQNLAAHPENISLEYERIIIPEVSLRVGRRSLDISPAKVERLLRNRHKAIKELLVAQTASLLKKGTGESILKLLEQYKIEKEYWFDSTVIKSQIQIAEFASQFTRNNLEVKLPGDFCTTKKFFEHSRSCTSKKDTAVSKSRIKVSQHEDSVYHMKTLIDKGDANIVASISEDYVNKLLVTTYDAGLWKEALDEAGVVLGPRKVFMRLDERGGAGTLFMDVVYTPKKIERLALGVKEVRFPMVMRVALRVEKHDGVPVVLIRLNDVDLSDDTLIKGRPDLDMVSTIQDIPRLKQKVVKTIRHELEGLKNKDVLDLRYPELKGLGLETIEFTSDGNGRMNAAMRLQDLIEEKDY